MQIKPEANIKEKPSVQSGAALWNLGFRPFFMGAAYFGALSIALWAWTYHFGTSFYPESIAPGLWHAHEMLFGYVLAVIAGFLLTASKNWTGLQTLHRAPLASLFLVWVGARLSLLVSTVPVYAGATLDLVFNAGIFLAIAVPLISTRQSRQYAILGKLFFLLLCNGFFYAEMLGYLDNVARLAIYIALYTVIGLVLMMCRRLIPFFIEAGAGYKVVLRNSALVDRFSLFLFLGFLITEVFMNERGYQFAFAALLVPVLAIRAWWWFTPAVLQKPLLFSLYSAYWLIILGFALFAIVPFTIVTALMALHMLTIGGIGLITVSMMSRVSLGHSGRNIHQPPKLLTYVFAGLVLAAFARVIGPALWISSYKGWVLLSAFIWFLSLLAFAVLYTPIWLRQRIDGRYG